ncbi:MAG: hypothetical protein QOD66_3907, partial [Solirubrobacteraceae bacterium]|nr:hypothetical protein [Solirubrobacteraceae bacterium]
PRRQRDHATQRASENASDRPNRGGRTFEIGDSGSAGGCPPTIASMNRRAGCPLARARADPRRAALAAGGPGGARSAWCAETRSGTRRSSTDCASAHEYLVSLRVARDGRPLLALTQQPQGGRSPSWRRRVSPSCAKSHSSTCPLHIASGMRSRDLAAARSRRELSAAQHALPIPFHRSRYDTQHRA